MYFKPELGAVLAQARQRPAFVAPHQAGVADPSAATIAASLRCSRANGIPYIASQNVRVRRQSGNRPMASGFAYLT